MAKKRTSQQKTYDALIRLREAAKEARGLIRRTATAKELVPLPDGRTAELVDVLTGLMELLAEEE